MIYFVAQDFTKSDTCIFHVIVQEVKAQILVTEKLLVLIGFRLRLKISCERAGKVFFVGNFRHKYQEERTQQTYLSLEIFQLLSFRF